MKKFLQLLMEYLTTFIGSKPEDVVFDSTEIEEIHNTLELALYKKSAVHVIYNNRSFTGEILKYDLVNQRLILKNFKQSVTTIIPILAIQKLSLIPDSITYSQKQEKS